MGHRGIIHNPVQVHLLPQIITLPQYVILHLILVKTILQPAFHRVFACVNSTSSTLSLSSTVDYRVPGAVFSWHLGAAVTKIKDATLTSPGAWERPLALLHPTYPKEKSSTRH